MKFSAGIWRRLSSAYGWPAGSPVARSDKQETTSFTWAGNDPRVLQFLPPLILSDAEADELVERLRAALG